MKKLKQVLLIARCGLHSTFTDTRMVIPLLLIGFIYDNGVRRFVESAKSVQAPIGMFEPFILCMNDWKYTVVFLLGFIFILSGIPRVNNEFYFYIHRADKLVWLFGELLNVIVSSFLYLSLLFLVCLAGGAVYSFPGNVWSRYVVDYELVYKAKASHNITIDDSVFRYELPFKTALNAFLLMFLCLVVLGSIVLLLSIFGKKIIGLLLCVLCIGFMVIFSGYRSWWMWFFPTSHGVISLHHIYIYKKEMVELSFSYIYLLTAEFVLAVMSCVGLKRKNYI